MPEALLPHDRQDSNVRVTVFIVAPPRGPQCVAPVNPGSLTAALFPVSR